jgi:hypothetical protein
MRGVDFTVPQGLAVGILVVAVAVVVRLVVLVHRR